MICLKNVTTAPPQLQQMLQEYMIIKYHSEKDMLLTDGLSRFPNKNNTEVIDLEIKVDFVQFSIEKLSQIHQATNTDTTLCDLRNRFFKSGQNLTGN